MMVPVDSTKEFMRLLYRISFGTLFVAALVGLIAAGWHAAVSLIFGFLPMVFDVWLWDRVTLRIIKPRKVGVAFESILLMLRFGLLAGAFYAMIRLFVVNLPSFVAGFTLVLFCLVAAALLHKDDVTPPETPGSEANGEQ